MSIRKTKTIKFKLLSEGDVIDYQTLIEEVIGDNIAKLSCYNHNHEQKSEFNGQQVDADRAYFVADCDYEIIIRPVKS